MTAAIVKPAPTTGRFSLDEISAFAALDGKTFTTVSKAMTDEEIAAVYVARNVLAAARVMEELADDFITDYDAELAAEFVASLPVFAETFAQLFKKAVVKDGRGGGNKALRRVGHVSWGEKGDARVSAIDFPTPEGSLRIILQSETNDKPESKETE